LEPPERDIDVSALTNHHHLSVDYKSGLLLAGSAGDYEGCVLMIHRVCLVATRKLEALECNFVPGMGMARHDPKKFVFHAMVLAKVTSTLFPNNSLLLLVLVVKELLQVAQ
jgi:hypothetical protein